MSMIARFVAITPDQLATIKDTPEMVGGVFALDAGLPFESPSDLGQRLRRQAPQLVADMLERLPPAVRGQLRQRLGLGDNGLSNPGADNVVFGGSEIGEDRGYRPARYFAPSQVAEIAGALQSPGLERELHGRFDGEAMTELGIYPGVWETDDHDWLLEAFHTLRDFYAAASEAEQAVVTLIE